MTLPVLVSPPGAPPVTLGDVKRHLRIDHADDDGLIGTYIAAAVEHLDALAGILGRCLVSQQWRQDFHRFCHRLDLAFPHVATAAVEYLDADGAAIATDHEWTLRTDSEEAYLTLARSSVAPSGLDIIRVTFTAGYGTMPSDGSEDPNPVPGPIRSAILLMVGDLYRFRETAEGGGIAKVEMSVTADRLLTPYRRYSI